MHFWKVAACLVILTTAYLTEAKPIVIGKEEFDLENFDFSNIFADTDLVTLIQNISRLDAPEQRIVINNEIDIILKQINKYTFDVGLDPTKMPDILEKFEVLIFWGQLILSKGWLQGLSSLQRIGDVTFVSDGTTMSLRMPLTFRQLWFDYQYDASIMGLGPSGGIDGRVDEVQFVVNINVDIVTLQAELKALELLDEGKISLTFNGTPIVDWLFNIISDVITTSLKWTIKDKVHDFVFGGVDALIRAWNLEICKLIGMCS